MITNEQLTSAASDGDFSKYVRETRGDYRSMAHSFIRKWNLRGSLDVDDVVQEMLLHTHMAIHDPSFDPKVGTLRAFVLMKVRGEIFRELVKAQKLKSQRDITEEFWGTEQTVRPAQEGECLVREMCEVLPKSDLQFAVLTSLVNTGSRKLTTEELLAHPATRAMFDKPETAGRSVQRITMKLGQRYMSATA